jgi:hypothetical protein
MLDVDDAELTAVRGSFCMLVARWRLTQGEVRDLLGEHSNRFVEGRVLPDVLGHESETRMRLLLRLESALEHLAAGADVCAQMRSNRFESGITPLAAISSLPALRAAVRLAEQECAHGKGGSHGGEFG